MARLKRLFAMFGLTVCQHEVGLTPSKRKMKFKKLMLFKMLFAGP